MQNVLDQVLQELEALRNEMQNRVLYGGRVAAPTTSSTQASGVGNTTWRVNISEIMAVVGGVAADIAAQADYAIHSGSLYTGLSSGNSAVATVVMQNSGGTVSMAVVKGAAAATGSQVAPTDAEIQAALGAGVEWIKVAECLLNRTADTTVTQSQDNLVRPMTSVNEETSFGDWSAYT
jgi:hypothetical protein